jgi:alkylhydroperoxidase family enzyme
MTRVSVPDDTAEFPFNYVFSTYAPEISKAAINFSRAVYEHTLLSLREMEAARYRTALINGCMVCTQARAARDFDTHMPTSSIPFERPMSTRGPAPDESFYSAVTDWQNARIFSTRERLAIEYAERLGERPRSMQGDEAFWSRMRTNFSDREIVDLSLSIGSWIALGRVSHALELDTVCIPVRATG